MIDYDLMAGKYAHHRRARAEIVRHLCAGAGLTGASRVLEVGCGTGNYIGALQVLLGCACHGIDPAGAMLTEAGKTAAGVEFQPGRAEALHFPDSFFTLIFSVDAVHFFSDPGRYFREAYRVLRPGGRVCTLTESEWIIRHRAALAKYFPETVPLELARYPRIRDLGGLMREAGFSVDRPRGISVRYELMSSRAYQDKVFSSLLLIQERDFARGIARLETDLRRGPVPCISRRIALWGTRPPLRTAQNRSHWP